MQNNATISDKSNMLGDWKAFTNAPLGFNMVWRKIVPRVANMITQTTRFNS